jgi:peptide/nickel transport system substrate-binding protein
MMPRRRWGRAALTGLMSGMLLAGAACQADPADCPRCDTLVIAALGEPTHLLPPFAWQGVARDIGDLVFERLAVLSPARSPLDPTAYRPGLAMHWTRVDSLTWDFHLRPGARWHDGQPVTAHDVVFSFTAHQDPVLDAASRSALADLTAQALDEGTVRVTFATARPDQFYDATWHVRVFPRHVWSPVPVADWGARVDPAQLVGSGPYRVVSWQRGATLRLAAASDTVPLREVVWRFAADPDAAANLLLSGEADLLEALPNPRRRAEFVSAAHLALVPHSSPVYGFLGFNLAGSSHWSDGRVRRALRLALDRDVMARAVLGEGTLVPDGPLSAQLWLWETPAPAPADSAAAAALLDEAGWRRGRDGVRRQGGRPLAIDILVPSTSAVRRDLAVIIQERWARQGVRATVTQVDFPVFQQRLGAGRFEAMIGAWYDEPHHRSLADQWTRAGWGVLNHGRYANPRFDELLAASVAEPDTAVARQRWREALAVLNADVPAIWLYTPRTEVVVSRRLQAAHFEPFAWLAELPRWRLDPARPPPVRTTAP